MAILGFELEEIARLLALLEAQDLDELVIEEEGRSLRVRGPRRKKAIHLVESHTVPEPRVGTHVTPHTPRPTQPKAHSASGNGAGSSGELPSRHIALTSPMVGVFSRSHKPGAPGFINVGERVAVNQTIGLIEAMKVFSEVPAEHSGIVVAIPAQDGQLVQAGTPLVILQRE